MQTIYPGGQYRPLGVQTEPLITPRILVWHTMVGSLVGTEGYFKTVNGIGYSGTESHFGVGHSTDKLLDGVVFQWQTLDRQADAQFDPGNRWCTSIENSDGGDPSRPFSEKQMEAHVNLALWWCRQVNVAPQIAKSYDGKGFAYHELFHEFNTQAHACPGKIREAQLRDYVWPEISRRWNGDNPKPSAPVFPLPAGSYFGPEGGPAESVSGFHGHADDLATWQRRMHELGRTLTADGHYGPQTKGVAVAFQQSKGLTSDGLIGRKTWDASW